jgi:beta-fructofuranosidase
MPWFPQNKYIWDFWFAWDQTQRLHLFYLQASQLDCRFNPEARHDRASVGHAILTDWGWQEISPDQPALTRSTTGDAWDDLAIWTGSIIRSPLDERYYLFYTSRRKADVPVWTPHEWQRSQNIGVATSTNLSDWQRLAPNSLVIPNPGSNDQFDGVNWRDPYVVYHPQEELFYAFICAHTESGQDAGGIVAYVTSPDLAHWTASPQILVASGDFYQMEVPQVFWRDRGDGYRQCYLIFSAQDKDCSRHWRGQTASRKAVTGTYYLVSEPMPVDQPITFQAVPWRNSAQLLSPRFYSGKVIWPEIYNPSPLTSAATDIAIFYSFQWNDEAGQFVGGLADPQMLQFLPDGAIELVGIPMNT